MTDDFHGKGARWPLILKLLLATPMALKASSAWWAQTGRLTAPYVMDLIIFL